MEKDIGRILAENSKKLGETCEEVMVQDCEGIPDTLYAEAGMNWEHVEEYSELSREARAIYGLFAAHVDSDHESALQTVRDNGYSVWDSWSDYLDEWEMNQDIPHHLSAFIDWEAVKRSEEINGNFIECGDLGLVEFYN